MQENETTAPDDSEFINKTWDEIEAIKKERHILNEESHKRRVELNAKEKELIATLPEHGIAYFDEDGNEVPKDGEKAPAPMDLWSVDDAVNAGEAEEKLVPKHMYDAEDIASSCAIAILRHRDKTDFTVPCIYDDYDFLKSRIQEVVGEAARPNPEQVLNKWHDAWLAMQLRDGWQYGEVYSVSDASDASSETWKQSPLIMPYVFCPPEYQAIGQIYWNTVRGLMHFWNRT